ncbi:MAG: class C sortase [Clostridiales bacterium]|nr:class C sortase [Candidatus Crickella caballi]
MERSKKNRKKGDNLITTVLVLVLIAGLSLLLYPSIANWWNSFHQTRVISDYVSTVSKLDEDQCKKIMDDAHKYNSKLAEEGCNTILSSEQKKEYDSLLDFNDDGIMGYIEIPLIQCQLPIYHGTADEVLQFAAGHIEWTSLPVGGESTHAVISGHRGLPSARLFTDIDRLVVGDVFSLKILNETLCYEVDQIKIVLPEETEDLQIVEGKDYCTLITCTPYGVNTHRLLVRGHRIPNNGYAGVPQDAMQIEPMIIAPIVALPMLLVLLIAVILPRRKNSERK